MGFFEEQEQLILNTKEISWKHLDKCPKEKGCYLICHIGLPWICYIGESKNMFDRLYKHHRTGNHSSFRRNLEQLNSNNNEPQGVQIKQFLDECVVKCLPMEYGRKELQEYLIDKYKPI